jgi:hypothetical protein
MGSALFLSIDILVREPFLRVQISQGDLGALFNNSDSFNSRKYAVNACFKNDEIAINTKPGVTERVKFIFSKLEPASQIEPPSPWNQINISDGSDATEGQDAGAASVGPIVGVPAFEGTFEVAFEVAFKDTDKVAGEGGVAGDVEVVPSATEVEFAIKPKVKVKVEVEILISSAGETSFRKITSNDSFQVRLRKNW